MPGSITRAFPRQGAKQILDNDRVLVWNLTWAKGLKTTVLARLLEDRGEVISRTDLQKVLWPDGTHVDFEMGIKTAVKKLREALNDEADKPLYIQTVYGEGYRFIAPVTALS